MSKGFRLLLWPFQLPAVLMLVLFPIAGGLMLMVLENSGELFVLNLALCTPFFYGLLSMMALIGQRVLRRVSGGHDAESRPGDADVNPFQQPLAFQLGLLLAVVVLTTWAAQGALWPLLVLGVLFPLAYLGTALEESLFAGLRPAYAWRLISGLNLSYLLVVLLLSGAAFGLAFALLEDRRLPVLAVSGYAFLAAHGFTGWLLYAYRGSLELETERSPEQDAAAAQLAAAREIDELVEELSRLSTTGRLLTASERLEAFLGDRAAELDPVLHERLRRVQDPRLFLEHGVHYLQRLAERGEHGKAWAVFKDCLAHDERFRPLSDDVLLQLTRAAGREDARLVEQLLEDFPRAYEDSALASQAAFRRARVKIELLGEGTEGVVLLQELARADAEFSAGEEYQRYLARLKPSE